VAALEPVGVEGVPELGAAGDLAAVVEVVGAGEAQIAHLAAGPAEGVGLAAGGGAGADDPAVVVDGLGDAGGAAEGPEVAHPAAGPAEGVDSAGGGGAGADHLAVVVDVGGVADEAAEGSQIPHPALLPKEGVLGAEPGGNAVTDDLPTVVDGPGLAECVDAAKGAQVDDLAPGGIWCRRRGGRRRDSDQAP